MQSTNEETQVNESINNDPINTVVSQEIDDEQKTIWVAEPVLEDPEWDYECFHCGTEMEEHEGYLRDGESYCDSCAYDLFDQPKPKSKYTDEMWENFAGCKPIVKIEEVTSLDDDVEDNYDTYYTNKALCVTCGEVNYAEPVCEVEGRSRMVCCDCIEIVNRCEECHNLTLDYLYSKEDYNGVRGLDVDLCFDCKFKANVRQEIPLWVCWAIRSSIQSLNNEQFDILTDYAELAQLTIFDAYRYKSRCHFYDCERMVPPSQWDSEEKIQFCCSRHCDLADLNGCHCQNVYDGSHYDEDYEKATCKLCNSYNHETNMIPRIALRESDQDVKPIVSAICVFNEGICMSNVLAESLIDLHEYFI